MSPQVTPQLHVDIGGVAELQFRLTIAGAQESVTVSDAPAAVETQTSTVSTVLDERALADIPLNGRRFSDLALLSPGVTQDPRSLTSSTNGDLSFGGIRGFQNSFLVDGGDFNNGFFSQARGLYRAPYPVSTEVVQEFRVSSNTYGVELGRAGGAVINVVTKSGSNHYHGTTVRLFSGTVLLVARRSHFSLSSRMTNSSNLARLSEARSRPTKPSSSPDSTSTFTRIPDVVEFLNGGFQVVPQPGTGPYSPGDYELTDQALVFAAASKLTSLSGTYPASQIGNASYGKVDINLTPRHQLALRVNMSRYWGSNNVFLDPASPVSFDSISDNGKQTVSTETGAGVADQRPFVALISHLRAQFSRDLQQSYSNTGNVW